MFNRTHTVRNQKELKQNNSKRIFLEIRKEKEVIKSSLSRTLNLSFATVSNICSALERQGLLIERESFESTGGRRPVKLIFNPEAKYIIASDLSHNNFIVFALLDLDGNIIAQRKISLQEIDSFESIIDFIQSSFRRLLVAHGIVASRVIGLGVAIPGVFDPQTSIVVESSNRFLTKVRLQERLEHAFSLPVAIGNDANMAALAQSISFPGQIDNLLFVYFSKGIGLGTVIDGKIYLGTEGFAGELGHLKVVENEFVCECGQSGCFRIVTLSNILYRYFKKNHSSEQILKQQDRLVERLIQAHKAREKDALELMDFVGKVIGNVVGSMADIFNPHVIVLGGNISPFFDALMPIIRERARQRSYIANEIDLRILGVSNDKELILKGCGESVFQEWLNTTRAV